MQAASETDLARPLGRSPRRARPSPSSAQEWRAQAGTELATAQAEYAARRRALPALADRAQRTVLRAPLAGRINRVLVTTRGGSVRAGEPVVEIVPSEESLLIEAQDPAAGHRLRADRPACPCRHHRLRPLGLRRARRQRGQPSRPTRCSNERTGESFYTVQVRTDRERAARRATAGRCRSASA